MSSSDQAPLSDADIETAASILRRLEPGFMPYPIFEQVARFAAMPVIEFIPLRRTDSDIEVLLIERAADDPLWPHLLHTPGTIIRATDVRSDETDDNWEAFERITHDELKDTKVSAPHYIGSIFHKSKRGAEQAQLYWVEVQADPRVGQFYSVDNLPEGLIDSQLKFIREAARHFQLHAND